MHFAGCKIRNILRWLVSCSFEGMILNPGEGSELGDPASAETLRSQWNLALRQGYFRSRRKSVTRLNGGLDVTKLIDDLVRGSVHWIALHDMKLKWGERTAQIDHLLINQQLEIHLVHGGLIDRRSRCCEGKWEEWRSGKWNAIPSPIEDCHRKLFVIRKLVESERLAPHHHGVALPTSFKSLLLVRRDFQNIDSQPDGIMVWNVDMLTRHLRQNSPQAGVFFTTLPPEILSAFGQRLLAWYHHEPHIAP